MRSPPGFSKLEGPPRQGPEVHIRNAFYVFYGFACGYVRDYSAVQVSGKQTRT